MLNFDPKRYVEIESGAVALAEPLRKVVDQEMGAGAENLFFLGCGGVAFLMQPAAQLRILLSARIKGEDLSAPAPLPTRHRGARDADRRGEAPCAGVGHELADAVVVEASRGGHAASLPNDVPRPNLHQRRPKS